MTKTTNAAKYEAAKAAIQAADKRLTLIQADYERAAVNLQSAQDRLRALGLDPDVNLDACLFDMKSKVVKAEAKLTKDIKTLEGAVDESGAL